MIGIGKRLYIFMLETEARAIDAVPLKGLFNNPSFEIGFERIKHQFSQNSDIDGTRSTTWGT